MANETTLQVDLEAQVLAALRNGVPLGNVCQVLDSIRCKLELAAPIVAATLEAQWSPT